MTNYALSGEKLVFYPTNKPARLFKITDLKNHHKIRLVHDFKFILQLCYLKF
jgi:hypothetical protein